MPHPPRSSTPLIRALTTLLVVALPLVLQPQAAWARQPLNPDIETMCEGLALINQKLGATAAPGTPMAELMEQELVITAGQYEALWSLMKLTPTPICESLY